MKCFKIYNLAVLLVCTACAKTKCPPCTCLVDHLYGGLKVDCSKRNLKEIPNVLPVKATTLLFHDNNLTNLTGHSLKKLNNLRILDLSNNSIFSIEEESFTGQSALIILNLSANHLALDSKTYKPNVFRALRELKVLRIEDNNHIDRWVISSARYPDNSLSLLTSLKELHVDGLPADFGRGFAQIRNLTTLSLSSKNRYCYLPVLRNTTFQNVPALEQLNISNCAIKSSEFLTFKSLKHIKSIDISDNRDLGFSKFSNATYGLQFSPIQVIRMNRIYPEYDVCSRVQLTDFTYLCYTKLKELHIDGNGIIGAQIGALSLLPQSLEVLSAKENKLQYGHYLKEISSLKYLKHVDVSGINKMNPLPFLKRHAPRQLIGFHLSSGRQIRFPPKLETLIASGCSFSGKITPGGVSSSSLKKILLNNNYISALGGPVTGYDTVEHLDFSNNVLEDISYDYFAKNNSISNLSLSNNFLSRPIAKDVNGEIFSKLGKARILDISKNRIAVIPNKFFKGLINIEYINISYNYLETFDVDFAFNKNLTELDLAGNKLQMLPSSVLSQLKHVSHIHLYDNPMLCSCGSLYFLRWIEGNKGRIDDLDAVTCTLTTSEHKESFRNLDMITDKLEKECYKSGDSLSISVTLSLFLLLLSFISVSVCYRHRWKLRYLYHVGRRAYRQQQQDTDIGDDDTYQYDVFVSYAAPDRRFVIDEMMPEIEDRAGLRMCIHDRDFLPGEVISINIVTAIQNSRKTLILLTPSFLKSHWCEFEYNMARMESVTQRRDIVVVILYKPVPLKALPKDMAIMFKNNCYLEYNEEEFGSIVFWENVKEAIMRQPE